MYCPRLPRHLKSLPGLQKPSEHLNPSSSSMAEDRVSGDAVTTVRGCQDLDIGWVGANLATTGASSQLVRTKGSGWSESRGARSRESPTVGRAGRVNATPHQPDYTPHASHMALTLMMVSGQGETLSSGEMTHLCLILSGSGSAPG